MRRRTIGEIEDDKRRKNGGTRAGAGRPLSPAHQRLLNEHLMEWVVVKEYRHGQVRRVKKRLITAMLDALFKKAIQGEGNTRAIKAYLDLALGKPRRADGSRPRFNSNIYTKHMGLPNYEKPPSFLRVTEAQSKRKPRS